MRKNFAISFLLILATVFVCFVSCTNEEHSVDQLLRGLKVTFNSNYEGGPSERTQYLSVSSGDKQFLERNSFKQAGYTFLGWAESSDSDEVKYEDGSEVNFSNDKKLYAVWQMKPYTISFDLDGGTIDGESSLEVVYDEDISTSGDGMLPRPEEKEGYKFGGWYLDKTFNKKVVGNKVDKLRPEDGDKVYLYAYWIPNEEAQTVTFMSNYPWYKGIKEK